VQPELGEAHPQQRASRLGDQAPAAVVRVDHPAHLALLVLELAHAEHHVTDHPVVELHREQDPVAVLRDRRGVDPQGHEVGGRLGGQRVLRHEPCHALLAAVGQHVRLVAGPQWSQEQALGRDRQRRTPGEFRPGRGQRAGFAPRVRHRASMAVDLAGSWARTTQNRK